MTEIILTLVIALHGVIHMSGFAKAFNLAPITQLKQPIPKIAGIFWLATTLLFLIGAILLFGEKDFWWMPAVAGLVLSQNLIFTTWDDAKFGTVINILLLFIILIGYGTWSFKRAYQKEVINNLNSTVVDADSLLTEADLASLPEPVKRYIRYVGAIGRPKVNNFKIELSGQIRKNDSSEWMPFTSEQYNFLNPPTRLFFMNATMNHLPISGFHSFKNGTAFMDIRLLSLIKVQYQAGEEMGKAETVTFFNDMSCMAPATLVDKRITWLESDSTQAKAEFSNNGITIAATFYFSKDGALINFVSDDRYAAGDNDTMEKLRWSTPFKDYKEIDGHRMPGYAEAIYHYPTGNLVYGTFQLTNVTYNNK